MTNFGMLNPCRKTLTTRIPLTWNSPNQPLKEREVNMPDDHDVDEHDAP
jgi:hypothetical protein